MKEYGLTALVAAAVTYLLIPLVRRFATAIGAIKQPRERDVHTQPVPTLGGLAIYGGMAAGLLVASRMFPLSTVFRGTRVGSGLLLAGAVVVLIGFVDDRWGLGAITKAAGQVAAAVVLVWSGALVPWLPLPGGGTLALTSDQQTALTILIVVVTINAVNFIDGLDGLAAGIVAIGAAAFYLYYYTLAKRLGLTEQDEPALAAAVLGGMCVGFLPHNFYPARIFMGDTGSMLLGLLLAYAPISSLATLDPNTLTAPAAYRGGTVNRFPEVLPLLVPAIIMLIPYADLLLAVVRRTRAGMSPFAADKKHLQHRLLDIGHSHRASVLIMYMWAALFAGTVVLLSIMRTKLYVLGIVTLGGVLVLLLLSLPRLRWWARPGPERPAVLGAGSPAGRGAGPNGQNPALAGAALAAHPAPAGIGRAARPVSPGYLPAPVPAAPVLAAPVPAAPVPAVPARSVPRAPAVPPAPVSAAPVSAAPAPAGRPPWADVPARPAPGPLDFDRPLTPPREAGNGHPGPVPFSGKGHAGNGHPGNGHPGPGPLAGKGLGGPAAEPGGRDAEPGGRAAEGDGEAGPGPDDDSPPWHIGRPGAG